MQTKLNLTKLKPGLSDLYAIQLGNRSGLFYSSCSLHRVYRISFNISLYVTAIELACMKQPPVNTKLLLYLAVLDRFIVRCVQYCSYGSLCIILFGSTCKSLHLSTKSRVLTYNQADLGPVWS